MRKGLLTGASVLVVALLLLASMPADFRSRAGPSFPHEVWGIARDKNGGLLTDEMITSWVDGVSYGANYTLGDGNYTLQTAGNWTLDYTPEVKEGGWFNESIMYMRGNGTSFDTNTIFKESSLWDMGASIDFFNLTEADMGAFTSFGWLKINNITVDSMAVGTNVDYVQIYNPLLGSQVDILGNYSFQKNDGVTNLSLSPTFPITAVSLEPNQFLGLIDPGKLIWVNLSAIPGLNIDSADELKLVWRNPGPAGIAPFNGTDVIVDRVEWGNQSWEPDNTTMEDGPAALNTISRIVMGQDTNNCTVDFEASGEIPWPIVIPAQVVVTATHVAANVRLDWTPIPPAFGYKIYVSRGDATFATFALDKGNPTAILVGWSNSFWINLSGYDSPEDYGYIVRSYASGGENTTDGNNIAYKYRHTLSWYPGKFAGHNFLALPYNMTLAGGNTGDALRNDINASGSPPNRAVSVQRWDSTAPAGWKTGFNLMPGETYRVIVSNNTTYTIVGAHRGAPISLQYGTSKGENLNFVSLPYHLNTTALPDASSLRSSVSGSSRVAIWDGLNNIWLSKTTIGIDFPLAAEPAVGYLVVTTNTSPASWAPPVKVF